MGLAVLKVIAGITGICCPSWHHDTPGRIARVMPLVMVLMGMMVLGGLLLIARGSHRVDIATGCIRRVGQVGRLALLVGASGHVGAFERGRLRGLLLMVVLVHHHHCHRLI